MRIVHLSFSDSRGGAAIGAYRLHRAMRDAGLDSHMLVIHKSKKEDKIHPLLNAQSRKIHLQSVDFGRRLKSLYNIDGLPIRSFNLRGTDTSRAINKLNPDIVQMHWIGLNTIRIDDIKNINAPVLWKMPDMWAFSGAEHYTNADEPQRHRDGYDSIPCFRGEAADIDRLVWEYKKTHYPDIVSLTMISPSRFLAHEAHQSVLLKDRNCHVIPNPLPTEWLVLDPADDSEKNQLRVQLGISGKRLVIFFGAFQTTEKRKGFHHIEKMVENHLSGIINKEDLAFIVAGGERQHLTCLHGYDVHIYPCTPDFRQYSSYLRACDLMILPSEMENSAMVIQEALACGIPAIVFDIGGMPDLVHHGKSGYLAAPYQPKELADGISWWLECSDKEFVRSYSKNLARSAHNPRRCTTRYVRLYQDILEKTRTGRPVCEGRLFDHNPEIQITDVNARLFIIEPFVKDWTPASGEAAMALSVRELAAAEGVSSYILANSDCTPITVSAIEPVLSGDLAATISKLVSDRMLNSRDALFFPSIDHTQADAILNLVAIIDHPDAPCFHLNIPEGTADTPEYNEPLVNKLRTFINTNYLGSRIYFYTNTEAMSERLSRATGIHFTPLVAYGNETGTDRDTGIIDITPLFTTMANQGLSKNETILHVRDSIHSTEQSVWAQTGNAKFILLLPKNNDKHDAENPPPCPMPVEPFYLVLEASLMPDGSWQLPDTITGMLNNGKFKTVVLHKDIPPSLIETLKHESGRFAIDDSETGHGSSLFVEYETFIGSVSANSQPVQQQNSASRNILLRVPRAVLRRGKNLFCRLCNQ